MTKLDDLTSDQRSHLAWRLDHNTCCGYGTAARIAEGEAGNLDLVEIFQRFGDRTKRSAQSLARLVEKFTPDQELTEANQMSLMHFQNIMSDCKNMTPRQQAIVARSLIGGLKSHLSMMKTVRGEKLEQQISKAC